VVILTTFELDEYVFDAICAGAAGFLVKDTGAAELLRAVRVVAGGEALLSPGVTRRLIAEFASRARPAGPVPGIEELTPREREVVALIAAGLSNDEVAAQLYVTSSTAKTHANRAMAKLRARDRAQLVVFAYQAGNPCSRIPAWGAVARPDQRSPRPGGARTGVRSRSPLWARRAPSR
jgi:DNA-binding NarL/FixJ family response regulator